MKLKEGYEQLVRQIGYDPSEEESKLVLHAQRRLPQIELFLADLAKQAGTDNQASPEQTQVYRKLKLELRFAQRRWQRIVSNEARLRKTHEKRPHVSTFAA